MNPGSSIMADKLIHELGHTFSTFPYQELGLNEFTCVVYAGDDGVVPLCSLRQVGDEINAKLGPGFKRYMYRFQLISTLFKFGTSLHMLACFTAVKLLHLICYVQKVNLDDSKETVLSNPKWPLIALTSTVVPTPSWDIRTNLHCFCSYLTEKNCTTTMKFLGIHSIEIH